MTLPKKPSPEDTANQVAKTFFGVGDDPASTRAAVRRLLLGAVEVAVLIPALFYLRFGVVGGLGWGMTVFFVVYCLLAAVGLHFRARTDYHTPVALRGDWLDRIGAFWLVACAFGPLFGWIATSMLPLTPSTWRWVYLLRVALAAALPLITALPLTRYLRGKATLVGLPILVIITLLPIWSVTNVAWDLWQGPVLSRAQDTGQTELYLQHTDRYLGSQR